jgi:hypothetical protein
VKLSEEWKIRNVDLPDFTVKGLRAETACRSARLDRAEPSWKGFSHIGEELFVILAHPRRNAQARAFTDEPLDLLAGCPPLESRYVIHASPLTGARAGI